MDGGFWLGALLMIIVIIAADRLIKFLIRRRRSGC
ncbi:hypothetical protein MAXJ12_13056 [Mesorhizobium alhagi CCNWXJ12-2]|uniref:Uncharacterized protein n=1 Tax=Mesorhizobium alhagi CCNWXJ12-2 TaxID=1107882 RepID=H0HR28_9HYPH|nr:hypothetical protein MAXJ12_13056 [Mesorhizobium alhagi CCNWXJ12-2]